MNAPLKFHFAVHLNSGDRVDVFAEYMRITPSGALTFINMSESGLEERTVRGWAPGAWWEFRRIGYAPEADVNPGP